MPYVAYYNSCKFCLAFTPAVYIIIKKTEGSVFSLAKAFHKIQNLESLTMGFGTWHTANSLLHIVKSLPCVAQTNSTCHSTIGKEHLCRVIFLGQSANIFSK